MIREELIKHVLKNFLKDLNESAKMLTSDEGITFTKALIEYLKGVYNHRDYNPEYDFDTFQFDEDEFIEERLLTPFRQKMVPFIKTRLRLYFAKDDYNKSLLFKKLNIEEPVFADKEYEEYILRVFSVLEKLKEGLYLKTINLEINNSSEARNLLGNPEEMEKLGFKAKNKEYTRTRQIMLYFFVLELMGINRYNTDVLTLAEFGHVLFNWPVDVVKNNDLYKKLRKAPAIHNSEIENIKDLEFVKRQFEKLEHAAGIALVQKQIDSLKRR